MDKKTTTSSELFNEIPQNINMNDPSMQEPSPVQHPDASKLMDELQQMELRLNLLEKENLTLIADMNNLRRRCDEDIKRSRLYSNQKIIEALLPALDVLDLALALPEDQHTLSSLLQGYTMTQTQINQVLESHGLEKIKTDGQAIFNPEEHEAIQTSSHEELPPQCIVQTFQTGYKLNGRVIRTSKVSINEA